MMNLLPAPKRFSYLKFLVLKSPKKRKYALTALVDFILIVLILVFGKQPAQIGLISPIASSINSVYSVITKKFTKETFAFVPDLASNKFDKIDLAGLSYLSFFDLPITDGGINYNSRGYGSFTSDEAQALFDRARQKRVKVLLTISGFDSDIINNLLDDPSAQDNLASQVAGEIKDSAIDGVVVDFEYPNGEGKNYQARFSGFIDRFTKGIHQANPASTVAVAIPSSLSQNQSSIYDTAALSAVSDRIFLIASDFIVPEVNDANVVSGPVFGFSKNDYFKQVQTVLGGLLNKLPQNKLVMERAWYGNGNNYPLYQPNMQIPTQQPRKPSDVTLDQPTIDKLVESVPQKGRQAARNNIPLIAKALDDEGILNSNVLAYALATIEHETDKTFQPLEEIDGRISARRRGYEGGMNFFGRGFIQLTHLRNYLAMGKRIGLGDLLVKHPELASKPDVAAKILAAFFKDNNVANLASEGQFVAARIPINPDYNAYSVAMLAYKYETD